MFKVQGMSVQCVQVIVDHCLSPTYYKNIVVVVLAYLNIPNLDSGSEEEGQIESETNAVSYGIPVNGSDSEIKFYQNGVNGDVDGDNAQPEGLVGYKTKRILLV